MNQKKIPTILGIIIIVIIAVTIGMFTWKIEESNEQIVSQMPDIIPQQNKNRETQGAGNNKGNGLTIAEPVDSWKICKNIGAKYQMKYPSDWKMGLRGPFGFESKEECNIENMNFGNYDEGSKVDYFIKMESLSMRDAGEAFKGCNSLEDYFSKKPGITKNSPILETFILDNEKAVYLEKSPDPRVYTFHNKRIFEITGKNISQQTFNDFISTFKFLD